MTKKPAIDEKSHISHAGKPKVTLNFKNGSTIEFTEKSKDVDWKAVSTVLIEEWVTIEQLALLYPNVKIE